VVATGIDNLAVASPATPKAQPVSPLMELAGRLRNENLRSAERIERAAQSQLRSPAVDPAILPPSPAVIPISDHAQSAARRSPVPHGRMSTVRNSIEAVLDMPALLNRKAN